MFLTLNGRVLSQNTVKGQCLFKLPVARTFLFKKGHIFQTWVYTEACNRTTSQLEYTEVTVEGGGFFQFS